MGQSDRKPAEVLGRVAQVLRVEPSIFSDSSAEVIRAHHEALEMLKAFSSVTDPADRKACLAFVQRLAATTEGRKRPP